jgi:hypothetical protein
MPIRAKVLVVRSGFALRRWAAAALPCMTTVRVRRTARIGPERSEPITQEPR